jgi:hypothetical protein
MTKVNNNSKCSQRQNWMAISKHWCKLEVDTNKHDNLNLVFAHRREEDEIYPLTRIEIAIAENKDQELKIYYKKCENTKRGYAFSTYCRHKVLCKNDKLFIPASLRQMDGHFGSSSSGQYK